ncbi:MULTISPECIES: GGDEF domain-containing protein [Pelosinus]|uniref:Diguanylate cyclase n=1 Tax=Pelosinus fermentans B4 TaxID=1149862 RepID=I9LC46_9FIRM|nr:MULTISPECIES: GGDEF domain-containing protein [Pelosinus]EIW17891.1 diguanylate cyclase [Pelosinus fermentans B4]EIW23853.1 diguanylate cyclase with PAS/PAC sensor [Pelosinus fermentans A11]OAM94776.1 diguanylate cyclase with PAS/PAC sensor [Pelosinus fermentans DSM 17108]SDR17287.1 PAS domain S-box-containing protein/diguanylate cyclase (GGDEF) domain-containing protein [Pelosinus fermentans]
MDMIKNMAFLDYLFDGIYLVDKEGAILFANQSAEKISGYSASEVMGLKYNENILQEAPNKNEPSTLENSILCEKTVYLRHKDHSLIPITIRLIPLLNDHGLSTVTLIAFTKTIFIENVNQVKDLARKAFVDTLTGLPNKEYLDSKLKSLMTSTEIQNNNTLGLFFVKLDNLKQINDIHGTLAGDMTLKAVAKILFENKQHPNNIICRWDSSLFFILTNFDKKFLMLNWATKVKNLLQALTVPGYNTLSPMIYISGVITPLGENLDVLYIALDEELKNSYHSGSNISIRDLPTI